MNCLLVPQQSWVSCLGMLCTSWAVLLRLRNNRQRREKPTFDLADHPAVAFFLAHIWRLNANQLQL